MAVEDLDMFSIRRSFLDPRYCFMSPTIHAECIGNQWRRPGKLVIQTGKT